MTSQKAAVVNSILAVLAASNIEYTLGGEVSLSSIITKEQKTRVKAMLFEGFRNEEISFSGEKSKLNDDAYLNKYVSGLLDNWIRKNPEFNGGAKYEIKNKGSRSGMQDATIKALRQLKTQTTDAKVLAEIEAAIQARLEVIKPTIQVSIDVNALPEHLRHLVSSK